MNKDVHDILNRYIAAELGRSFVLPDVTELSRQRSAFLAHFGPEQLAKMMLEAGKDVYVEKPLTLEVAHAEELCKLAKERNLILMVGHLLLYHPGVQYMKKMVTDGTLGEVYYIYCQRVNLGKVRKDENALWSFAPHDLSVVLHLLGMEPTDVCARGSDFLQKGIEDVVFVDLKFPGGKMAQRAGGPAALRTEGESSGQVLTAEVHDEGALRKLEQGLIPLLAAGPVRMVHAQHFGEYTHSVAVSFEGPLPASLLRSEGDNSAPGQDPSGLSRPPGVRTLTLVDPESRFALAIYRTELDSAAALDAASAQLRSAGYERDDRFASVASSQGRSLLRFTRKDQEVVVSAHVPHTDPHSTMLVYLSRSAQIPRFFPMIGR